MVSGGLQALAVLLCVAAAAKLAKPARAVTAMHQAGLPSSPLLVRLLALLEVAVAVSVLVVGGAGPALALAAAHVGFAAFLVRLRARAGASASCGCFGGAEAPADRLHVVVNVAAAVVAAAAAVTGADPLHATLPDQPALGLPYVVLLAVAVQAAILVLTELPRLLAATQPEAT
jgi:hypothetical protein